MNRLLAVITLAVSLACTGAPMRALAAEATLNWGSEVNPSRCPTDSGYRYLEINVTRKVEGDPTQGVLGNTWAIREFNQHIQVWKIGAGGPGTGAERFCALVRYQGSFDTLAGASPNGTDTIAAGIDGSFEGGYRLVFEAVEQDKGVKERGHLGTYAGPISLTDWQSFYYSSVVSNSFQWFGWIYHGGNNGAWATSIDGQQGDIVD